MINALLSAAPASDALLRVPPGDDAAVLVDGTTVSTDTLVEGVHWDHRLSAEDVGWKAITVSVSDVAAMGVSPTWALLAVSLPTPLDGDWVAGFARGVGAACRRWGVALIGGDTTRSSRARMVTSTVGGTATGPIVRRSGASPGDELWVAGSVGLAAGGWALPSPPPESLAALRRPEPPVALALELARQRLATAMMDVSDGLITDTRRLCAASGVGVTLVPEQLPQPAALAGHPLAERLLWAGGDDYALLFTASPDDAGTVRELAQHFDTPAWTIGRLTDTGKVSFSGRALPAPLWAHFAESTP